MIGDLSASLGFAFGALVPLILLLCFHQQVRHYEAVWRVSRNGRHRSPLNFLVSISNGREFCISEELDEEAADPILAGYQKVLAVTSRSVRFVVHVSVSLINGNIVG